MLLLLLMLPSEEDCCRDKESFRTRLAIFHKVSNDCSRSRRRVVSFGHILGTITSFDGRDGDANMPTTVLIWPDRQTIRHTDRQTEIDRDRQRQTETDRERD